MSGRDKDIRLVLILVFALSAWGVLIAALVINHTSALRDHEERIHSLEMAK